MTEIESHLYTARRLAAQEPPSREASLALTKIDEAIMWMQAARALPAQPPSPS